MVPMIRRIPIHVCSKEDCDNEFHDNSLLLVLWVVVVDDFIANIRCDDSVSFSPTFNGIYFCLRFHGINSTQSIHLKNRLSSVMPFQRA